MSKERNIARDYYTTALTKVQIKRKHGVSEAYVHDVAHRFDYHAFRREPEYSLIKVEKSQQEAALMLLQDAGIDFEVPEHFELTEYYQSKINHDDESL